MQEDKLARSEGSHLTRNIAVAPHFTDYGGVEGWGNLGASERNQGLNPYHLGLPDSGFWKQSVALTTTSKHPILLQLSLI